MEKTETKLKLGSRYVCEVCACCYYLVKNKKTDQYEDRHSPQHARISRMEEGLHALLNRVEKLEGSDPPTLIKFHGYEERIIDLEQALAVLRARVTRNEAFG